MAVPYTFGTATASIPLSQLDSNFSTAITLGNTAIQLGNTVTTLNNMTLANVTISSGNLTLTNVSATTANVTTANVVTMIVTGNETVQGNTTVTGTITGAKLIPTGTSVTGNGMYLPATNALGLSTNGTNAVYIDASQNVGIGTTSPAVKLDVGYVAGNVALRVQRDATNRLDFYQGGGVSYIDSSPASGQLAFATVGTERMRIDSSGSLLVGTTTSGGVGFTIGYDANGRVLTSNVSVIPFDVHIFKNSGTTVGKITINTASTAYTTTSDYRLKENITPISSALNVVAQLKPVNFTWKANGDLTQGFIAHELQAVVPDCVVGEKDAVDANGNPKYQGVDTSFLVATLTAAIQEQQALITSLTARIEALEAK